MRFLSSSLGFLRCKHLTGFRHSDNKADVRLIRKKRDEEAKSL